MITLKELAIRSREQFNADQQEQARRAEELWRNAGCPSGRDVEFWLQAERDMWGKTLGEMEECYQFAFQK